MLRQMYCHQEGYNYSVCHNFGRKSGTDSKQTHTSSICVNKNDKHMMNVCGPSDPVYQKTISYTNIILSDGWQSKKTQLVLL